MRARASGSTTAPRRASAVVSSSGRALPAVAPQVLDEIVFLYRCRISEKAGYPFCHEPRVVADVEVPQVMMGIHDRRCFAVHVIVLCAEILRDVRHEGPAFTRLD